MQKKRSSILCPNCRKLIGVNEPFCPYCKIKKPGSGFNNNFLISGMADPEKVVMGVIWLNVAMFVIEFLFSGMDVSSAVSPFGSLSVGRWSGITGAGIINGVSQLWTLLSANYLHANIFHILFNMVMFWQLAPIVIKEYGVYRMISIYTIGGISGYIVTFFAGIPSSLGASAAVCALIGSLLYFGKSRGGQYGQAMYTQLFGWVISIAVFGFVVPRINNWAHGGGIVAGIGLGWLLGYEERKREMLIHKTTGMICVVSTALVLLWAVLSGVIYRF